MSVCLAVDYEVLDGEEEGWGRWYSILVACVIIVVVLVVIILALLMVRFWVRRRERMGGVCWAGPPVNYHGDDK